MSIVGRVFAERKRLQAEQQTRNISRVTWSDKGTRTGEKGDRDQKNKNRQDATLKNTYNKDKEAEENWMKDYRRNTGKDAKGKYIPTKTIE